MIVVVLVTVVALVMVLVLVMVFALVDFAVMLMELSDAIMFLHLATI